MSSMRPGESGMFTHGRDWGPFRNLLAYTDGPAPDAQTQGWAFQALGDITDQRLAGIQGRGEAGINSRAASGH